MMTFNKEEEEEYKKKKVSCNHNHGGKVDRMNWQDKIKFFRLINVSFLCLYNLELC